MRSIALVLGTRPEAIKCAPVVHALRADPRFDLTLISTGQHREMLYEALSIFDLEPDIDLEVMRAKQTPTQVTYRSLEGLSHHVDPGRTDAVLVYGDTASSFAGALFGVQNRIPVVHLEAGLRSGNLHSPFPEEANRRMIGQIASLHLAATPGNGENLVREGIDPDSVRITGNPIVDALRWIGEHGHSYGNPALDDLDTDPRRVVLASAHRRESWGELAEIAQALADIAADPGVRVVVPMHPNPVVRDAMLPKIGGHPNITVVDSLPYPGYCRLMRRSDLIVSDSNGAEEEGPSLGKKTLVLREVTERHEGIEAGLAQLVDRSADAIAGTASALLREPLGPRATDLAISPYGDGRASERIAAALAHYFGDGPPIVPFTPTRQSAPGRGGNHVGAAP
ncbi:non-hydrolyzing UDP-N-acetylglucosamine 2-epimerase [Saccharopolyspora taberi]|uniref:UDP-N-acetylglucosamine 2-epimerase (non-hydrolyzing) n=1 Tax=Saccharopolyspora taberi TaxID=60895 RepID=A0ABN3V919_9PSEU